MDIAGVTWRSTNCGDMWFPINTSDAPADPIHEQHIFDSTNVISTGGDPEFFDAGIIRRANVGLQWS